MWKAFQALHEIFSREDFFYKLTHFLEQFSCKLIYTYSPSIETHFLFLLVEAGINCCPSLLQLINHLKMCYPSHFELLLIRLKSRHSCLRGINVCWGLKCAVFRVLHSEQTDSATKLTEWPQVSRHLSVYPISQFCCKDKMWGETRHELCEGGIENVMNNPLYNMKFLIEDNSWENVVSWYFQVSRVSCITQESMFAVKFVVVGELHTVPAFRGLRPV